jgi:hypothetical protein
MYSSTDTNVKGSRPTFSYVVLLWERFIAPVWCERFAGLSKALVCAIRPQDSRRKGTELVKVHV